jgi:small subunit ribosomal protein S12
MARINQLLRKNDRGRDKVRKALSGLLGCPQKRGRCVKVYTMKPKKPNSAIRKVVKISLISKTGTYVTASVPGTGHSIQKNAVVMFRGGRANDLPGVRYRLLRGKLDFTEAETIDRNKRRSFYGTKKSKK